MPSKISCITISTPKNEATKQTKSIMISMQDTRPDVPSMTTRNKIRSPIVLFFFLFHSVGRRQRRWRGRTTNGGAPGARRRWPRGVQKGRAGPDSPSVRRRPPSRSVVRRPPTVVVVSLRCAPRRAPAPETTPCDCCSGFGSARFVRCHTTGPARRPTTLSRWPPPATRRRAKWSSAISTLW